MRKEVRIKTSDNHTIYGHLDSEKNDSLVIFVHGLTGRMEEHHYLNAVPVMLESKIDTYRFYFYADGEEDSRKLVNSSLSTHISDLKAVIDNFKPNYKQIYLVGHSFGVLAILGSDLSDISKIVLWDPTTNITSAEEKDGEYIEALDKYILHWGMEIVVSKEFVNDWINFDLQGSLKSLTTPCKFIFAGESSKFETFKKIFQETNTSFEHTVVPGASHGFIEEGTEEKLFQETVNFLIK